MKLATKKIQLLSVVALLVGVVLNPLAASAAQTPPQDDRLARQRYEEQLKNRIEAAKNVQVELLEARKNRLEAARREDQELKNARQDRVDVLRKEQTQKQEDREKRLLETQKELLSKVIDTLITYAERLKERAQMVVNPTLKQGLEKRANFFLSSLEALNVRVKAATTSQQLRVLTVELRNVRNQMSIKETEEASIHSLVVLGYIDRFENSFVTKTEVRVKTMQEMITRLEATGKNVNTTKALLNAASERLTSVKTNLDTLKLRAKATESLSGAEFASIRVSLNGIKNELKTVYETLLEISEHLK